MKKLAWLPIIGFLFFGISNKKDPVYWSNFLFIYGSYQGLATGLILLYIYIH